MSMSEFERSRSRFNPREIEGLAKAAEAFPVDPKQAPAEDLRRRIWLALKSPAYKYDDRAELFKAVRAKVRERAAEKRATPVVSEPVILPFAKKPKTVEPLNTAELIKDAYAHEKRQPADAYDSEAEEEVRKPLGE